MARYEVTKAWQGVSVGDVIETDTLHDALKPNVRELPDKPSDAKLEVATPKRGPGRPAKEQA